MRIPSCLWPAFLASSILLHSATAVPTAKTLHQLCLPDDQAIFEKLQPVFKSTGREQTASEAESGAAAVRELSLEHVGGNRLLARVTFDQVPQQDGAKFILYLDADDNAETGRSDATHKGADLMVAIAGKQASVICQNDGFSKNPTPQAIVSWADHELWIALDMALPKSDRYPMRAWILSQRRNAALSTPQNAHVELQPGQFKIDKDFSDVGYRYKNNLVKYEDLDNKGLTYADVVPAVPSWRPRPVPVPSFNVPPKSSIAKKQGAVERQQIRANLREEAGIARSSAQIQFGVPFPEKAIFDAQHIRVLDAQSQEIPSQITPTVRWPDDSLKWVLIQVQKPMEAKADSDLIVEFGSKIKASSPQHKLDIQQKAGEITICTGPLKAVIDTKKFNGLRDVSLLDNSGKFRPVAASAPEGISLRDGDGKLFDTAALPPDRVLLEENGPRKVVVRVEGHYGNAEGKTYMRFVTRLTFLVDSAVVTVAHTHFDSYLATEFTELSSLTFPLRLKGGITSAELMSGDHQTLIKGSRLAVFQSDENHAETVVDNQSRQDAGRCPGSIALHGASSSITATVHDFWQRWPKGISTDATEVRFDLLPALPSAQYGTDLPYQLMFPFVQGKYRMKWGMSFTERISLDFSGKYSPAELAAEANLPVVAVLPADWYATSKGLGEMPRPMGGQFSKWDDFVDSDFKASEACRESAREYGFLNYGDWFGERIRNWGNNEYDRAHGLLLQFARTGNRDYYRTAIAATRHQADVDIVHDYPDPYYLGANHQHSIGHTGTWEGPELPKQATWSHKYDDHTDAQNGHTWSAGMCNAWFMSGDARVMDGALEEAEHITWSMAPIFNHLGTHERSAGWSLRAIMPLYRATYDPAYLQAAKKIADVAVKAKHPKDAPLPLWTHELPLDHSGWKKGIMGNNCFIMGIFLSGMKDYVEETGDAAASAALDEGTQWLIKSFSPETQAWPYSASPEGKQIYDLDGAKLSTLNPLIIAPVAYYGLTHDDSHAMEIVNEAMQSLLYFGGPNGDGKSLGQMMFFTNEALALLQSYYLKHDPAIGSKLLGNSPAAITEVLFAKARDAKAQTVRGGDLKEFMVRLTSPEADLAIVRKPVGALPKRAETASVKVSNSRGEVIFSETCSTDKPAEFHLKLSGGNGEIFKVEINDDLRGAWSVSSPNAQSMMHLLSGFRLAGVQCARYSFFVPLNSAAFSFQVAGVHEGGFGVAVVSPEDKVVDSKIGINKAGSKVMENTATSEMLEVRPRPEDTGKPWHVILWAVGDEGVELKGIPPYIALSEDQLFTPAVLKP